MGKKINRIKKFLVLLLIAGIFIDAMPDAAAKTNDPYLCTYQKPGEEVVYSYGLDKAFINCSKGGIIHILESVNIDFPDFIGYKKTPSNTQIIIDSGACVTLGTYGLEVDGELIVAGTLDLKNSAGELTGSGSVSVPPGSGGRYIKKDYDIEQKGDRCLAVEDIPYGTKLKDISISDTQIDWESSVEGTWEFADPEYMPQAGSRLHDMVFRPKSALTYDSRTFKTCGYVNVVPVAPTLASYSVPTVKCGQSLLDVQPKYSFVSPVTGKTVAGELQFESADQTLDSVGVQNVMAVFTPSDSNYKAVSQYLKVEVVSATPEVRVSPQARNNGVYGQELSDIGLLDGICVNPDTGREISGHWEWREPAQKLGIGENSYSVLFIPDNSGYARVERKVTVFTAPKVMEEIAWPECADLVYGQTLSNSRLSVYRNNYGTFMWRDGEICPDVKTREAEVIFTPSDTTKYDWSRIEGYNEQDKTISCRIPLRVEPLPGKLPEITTEAVTQGAALIEVPLRCKGTAGFVRWEDPDQEVTESGEYEAVFLPDDCSNYDWSEYLQEPEGGIHVFVPVEVIVPEPEETEPPEVSEEPEVTEEPEQPEVTEEPDETDLPEVTEEPDLPEVTEEPDEPDLPEVTEEPDETDLPEVTEEPGSTDLPEVTGEPGSTEQPEATEEPGSTEQPEATEEPGSTEQPEVTEEPGGTEMPEVTEEPGSTESPDVTEKPELPGNTSAPLPSVMPPSATPTTGSAGKQESGANGNGAGKVTQADSDRVISPIIITKMATRLSSIRSSKKSKAPKKTKIRRVWRSGSLAKIICRKISKANYEVQYKTKAGKSWKKARKKRSSKPAISIGGLRSWRKYYFRVRTWKKVKGKRIYAKWSPTRCC